MKTIVTGMNGTVAPAVAAVLQARGHETVPWNRRDVPPEDPAVCARYLERERPDWLLQIATGSPDWIEHTAALCRERGIRFLFTGTVSVFDGSRSGPFPADHPMDATDDYGRYKAECERRILRVNPEALIARLGWQIGDASGSNNMIDYFTRQQTVAGGIEASTGWIPSTAFLVDTATGLCRLMNEFDPGVYQLEGNTHGRSFFDIASSLNRKHGASWNIIPKDEPRRDNRMLEDRILMEPIDTRL